MILGLSYEVFGTGLITPLNKHVICRELDTDLLGLLELTYQDKVVHWNKALEAATGIRQEEMVGTDNHWRAFYNVRKRLLADGGRLSGLECLRMEPGAPDGRGRPRPVPIEGSEFIIPADTVINAVGQIPEAEDVSVRVTRIVRENGL
jgi:NADPH-dependent glutamate synthase beta subunit-like oxidoreductase